LFFGLSLVFDHFEADLDASLYLYGHWLIEQLASTAPVGLEGMDGKAPAGFSFYQESDIVDVVPLPEGAEEISILFEVDLEEGGKCADVFVEGFPIQPGFLAGIAFEADDAGRIFFRIELDNQYQSRHQAIDIRAVLGGVVIFFRNITDVQIIDVRRFLVKSDLPGCRTGRPVAGELKGAEIWQRFQGCT